MHTRADRRPPLLPTEFAHTRPLNFGTGRSPDMCPRRTQGIQVPPISWRASATCFAQASPRMRETRGLSNRKSDLRKRRAARPSGRRVVPLRVVTRLSMINEDLRARWNHDHQSPYQADEAWWTMRGTASFARGSLPDPFAASIQRGAHAWRPFEPTQGFRAGAPKHVPAGGTRSGARIWRAPRHRRFVSGAVTPG